MTATGLELLVGPDRKKSGAPTMDLIHSALQALAQGQVGWVTLSWGICHYVTASPLAEGGFAIEVEMGTRDAHVRMSGDDALPLETVIAIFECFAQKDESWMEDYEWERVSIGEIDFDKSPESFQGRLPDWA